MAATRACFGRLLLMSRLCVLLLWALSVLALLSVMWLYFYRNFRSRFPGSNVSMDPVEAGPSAKKTVPGGFEPHLQRYQDLAKLLLTLAAATIAFLVNFLTNISGEGKRNTYSLRLENVCPSSIALLGLSAACAIGFLLSENYAYETYCHAQTRDTYTPGWYALNLTLGFAGFGFFLAAYTWLALRIFM
jgi:hypothetical protein